MLTSITESEWGERMASYPLAILFALANDSMTSGPVSMVKQGFFVGPLNAEKPLQDIMVERFLDPAISGVGSYPTSYWVCDSPEQFIERYGSLFETDERILAVLFTPILKSEQSPEGGWRWHKWGQYIGDQTPTHEYIYDEPDIEKVYVTSAFQLSR